MKFLENIKINGKIEVLSGLHIGAGNEALEIGGLDNAVIKDPRTKKPYIPGSSLKGKMRFLTEWKLGRVLENGKVHSCKSADCETCRIFGNMEPVDDNGKQRGITRLIVRDAQLLGEFDSEKMLEIKYSTAINRMTGTAYKGSLRNIERVVPGVKFSFEIIYRVFDLGKEDDVKCKDNKDRKNFEIVINAMKLLENDTLGGSGSRGCGQIAFRDIEVSGGDISGNYDSLDKLLEKFNSGVGLQ